LKFPVFLKGIYRCSKYGSRVKVGWDNQLVVHPLALPARRHDAGPSQVRQVPRNLWLRRTDDFDEVTDTDFLPRHQVDEPQTRWVSQRTKKPFNWKLSSHGRSLA
jgi:hypothetical protein